MKRQRNTRQRSLVLDAVRARCDHPTAEQIYKDVRESDDKISRSTVYRNLNLLAKNSEIRLFKVSNIERFDLRLDSHYHLMCTKCAALCDLPISYDKELDRQVGEKTGYEVKGHNTIFEGLCPDCQSELKQS